MKFINMIKQIKYQRCFGRIIEQLTFFEHGEIVEFNIITPKNNQTLFIFYINTKSEWVCINDEILLNIFNIKYTIDVHKIVLEFLHYYDGYEFLFWDGQEIKF